MYTGSSNGGRSVAMLTYTSKGQSMVEAGRGTWNFRRFVIVEIRLLQALGIAGVLGESVATAEAPHLLLQPVIISIPCLCLRSSYAAGLQESLVWFWRAAEGSQGAKQWEGETKGYAPMPVVIMEVTLEVRPLMWFCDSLFGVLLHKESENHVNQQNQAQATRGLASPPQQIEEHGLWPPRLKHMGEIREYFSDTFKPWQPHK